MNTELFGLPLQGIDFSSLVKMPVLEQQHGSLSALEKAQIGLLLMICQPKVIVETGVWRGRTTRFMSEFLSLNNLPGKIFAFDLPEIIDELQRGDSWFSSVENVKLMPGTLPGSLSDWITDKGCSIDFALVDATHEFRAVHDELSLIASHLSPQGYIMCHDYGRPDSKYEGVMCAVNEVAQAYQMVVLPIWSEEDASIERFCQAAILHKQAICPAPRRWFYWRRYYAKQYPFLARLWGRLRYLVLGD